VTGHQLGTDLVAARQLLERKLAAFKHLSKVHKEKIADWRLLSRSPGRADKTIVSVFRMSTTKGNPLILFLFVHVPYPHSNSAPTRKQVRTELDSQETTGLSQGGGNSGVINQVMFVDRGIEIQQLQYVQPSFITGLLHLHYKFNPGVRSSHWTPSSINVICRQM
jgi:hypothetical protein